MTTPALLQPLAGPSSSSGQPRPTQNGVGAVAASPRSPHPTAGTAGAPAGRGLSALRRGQLVLEGLSAPRVAARARVNAVAVLGAHVALSLTVDGPDDEGPVTALLGFAGPPAGAEPEEAAGGGGGAPAQGSGRRRRRPGDQHLHQQQAMDGPVASEEEQRRFLADLARGQLSRLPGLLLGEPTRAGTLGLHFFLLDDTGSATSTEPRLLATQADGLVRLWALRGRHRAVWVPLTSFLLPFRHRPLPGLMSFDGSSRRLVYVEAVGAVGKSKEEQELRVVSREVVFTPVNNDQGAGVGDGGGGSEVITVGCAVPVAHVAAARALEAVQAGSRGCWIVTASRVGYNCFRSKRLVWMERKTRAGEGDRRAFFALHAITEQLLALDPWKEGGTVSVYTAPGNGMPLTRRVLHRGLLACLTIAPEEMGGFAVHRNLALVSLPGRGQLAAFHLRTGDAWGCVPLPTAGDESNLEASTPPPRFWADRYGATALGLWWPERGNLLLRVAHPTAAEEQAFLASRGPGGLTAAARLCREHGPSLAHALSHRAMDAAYLAVSAPPAAAPDTDTVPPRQQEGEAAGSEEDEEGPGPEQEEEGADGPTTASDGTLAAAGDIPLVLRAGLVMAAGGENGDGDGGVERLAQELRAALRDVDDLRREARDLAVAPVPRSEEGNRREALSALARQLREGGDGRFRRVTPLLLAAEPLLREWLQQLEERGEGDEVTAPVSGSSEQQAEPPSPIVSGVDLAHAVCRAGEDRGALAAAWARVRADGRVGDEEEAAVLRPLLLYCCALGDDGFLEALSPLLFRLRPATLVHLVARLAEPDLQPLPFQQPLGEKEGGGGMRHDFYYRAHFLTAPVGAASAPGASASADAAAALPSNASPSSRTPPRQRSSRERRSLSSSSGVGAVPASPMGQRVQEDYYVSPSKDGTSEARRRAALGAASSSLNPFDEDGEEDDKGESMPAVVGPPSLAPPVVPVHASVDATAAAAEGDEGEVHLQASRAVYARALHLIEPELLLVAGDQDAAIERETVYRALLEGAGRFVCLARRLLAARGAPGGREDGWAAALALLNRLRTAASAVRAHHQVFCFLLGRALGDTDLGRVEAVMARRPCALTVADVCGLARRLRQEEQEQEQEGGAAPGVCMPSLKHCLLLLLQPAEDRGSVAN